MFGRVFNYFEGRKILNVFGYLGVFFNAVV